MLIEMRNALMAGSGLSAKSYVQDGLVAMWDGIENAGWGVHDPAATTWVDLIGDLDLTLTSSGAFRANCLYCNHATAAIGDAQINPSYAEFVIRCDNAFSDISPFPQEIAVMLYSYGSRFNKGFGITKTNNYGCITGRNANAVFDFKNINTINQYTTDFSSSSANKFRVNGDAIDDYVSTTWTYPGAAAKVCIIGGNEANQYQFKGCVYAVRAYARIPTSEEIAANYAVDKARFNLPDAT